MIIKIDDWKIEHQINIDFFLDYDNLIKAKQNKLWNLIFNQLNIERWNREKIIFFKKKKS